VNDAYTEPLHPVTGKQLTNLDRTLLQLRVVSIEISILLRGPALCPPGPIGNSGTKFESDAASIHDQSLL
jgi:hypothetical protein